MPLQQETKTDFRIYIGIVLFRWQIIVLCFLVACLCAVLFLNTAQRRYLTACKILVHRDDTLDVVGTGSAPLSQLSSHIYLLTSPKIRFDAALTLRDEWEKTMGGFGNMPLDVSAGAVGGVRFALNISVVSPTPKYGEAYLKKVIETHESEWRRFQSTGTENALGSLQKELDHLEAQIREAEEAVIEYKRLYDITRVEAKSSVETRYLDALMSRKSMMQTELMLIEAQNPMLTNENAAVISQVLDMTQKTGATPPEPLSRQFNVGGQVVESTDGADEPSPELPGNGDNAKTPEKANSEELNATLMENRVRLANLMAEEKEMSDKFKPENPKLLEVQKAIASIKSDLHLSAQLELGRLNDRYKALKISMNALEMAEQTWKARDVLAGGRRADLSRLMDIVNRYESNYTMLYARMQQLKVDEELRADQFITLEPVATDDSPIWPNVPHTLLLAMVVGLGVGFGLVILAHFFDNRVQTIRDVESELGVPFLGGVPFWADSGLEDSVRPIVTERDSIGAVEAYRSVRTSVLSALNKRGAKLVMITSADSKEGKTLTALNLAVTTAQMERKVLLVDLDLRRGRLHKSLGVERLPGVTEVLKGEATMDSVIQATRIKNLDFIPTGEPVENGAELLHAVDLRAVMQKLTERYDYVMVDTSPVLRVTDTVIAATEMGAEVLFVAHVNRTPKPMIRYALSLLKDVEIVGVVMNGIEMHRISSLYYAYQYPNYAYYSNAYQYGYDHAYGEDQAGQRVRRTAPKKTWSQRVKVTAQWLRRTFLPFEGGR